jgi:hypothetical protein
LKALREEELGRLTLCDEPVLPVGAERALAFGRLWPVEVLAWAWARCDAVPPPGRVEPTLEDALAEPRPDEVPARVEPRPDVVPARAEPRPLVPARAEPAPVCPDAELQPRASRLWALDMEEPEFLRRF